MAFDRVNKILCPDGPAFTFRKCRVIDEVHPGFDTDRVDQAISGDLGQPSARLGSS